MVEKRVGLTWLSWVAKKLIPIAAVLINKMRSDTASAVLVLAISLVW